MATAGTIASRAYAPKPGAPARPAIVRKACQQLAGGKNTGETLLTQNRKHYPRPRHSNDNGLVEAKNGAVIRKHMGYGHIASAHAETIEAFYEGHFNPYLNFHRPCGVPETRTDAKGKQRRVYRWYATPWEILRQLPDLARYLRPEITVRELERMARAESDTEAARNMQQAKQRMLAGVRQKKSA